VIGNRLKNRVTGEEYHVTNKPRTESIRVPTVFDAAKRAGLRTASFFWPETRDDPSIDYNIPEVLDAAGRAESGAVEETFLQDLRRGGVPIDLYYHLFGQDLLQGAADTIMAEAAAHVIRTAEPQLLALHILVTDTVQHRFGDSHYMSRSALTMADACVGTIRRAVSEKGLEESTTYIIAADHGFHSVWQEINLHPLFAAANLLDLLELHPSYWTLFVELTETFDQRRDQAALDRVFEEIRSLDGVFRVLPSGEYPQWGYPRFEDDPHVPGQYMIVADIDTFLISDPTQSSTARRPRESPSHGHGYLPSHPRMYPAFVMSGKNIEKGKRIGHIHNYDIAPTIVHLLDLEMEGLSGRILTEALKER
jgi:predicted AlkP superfamily pyrophosphatase or phosphodiesterase